MIREGKQKTVGEGEPPPTASSTKNVRKKLSGLDARLRGEKSGSDVWRTVSGR